MQVEITDQSLEFDGQLAISFQRTLRVPDDGSVYPLPPTFGPFPIYRARQASALIPPTWRGENAVLVPVYEREALWLAFDASIPHAIQVEAGGVNAVSGEVGSRALSTEPQNYIVAPPQRWLDGVNAGPGSVRQFTAVRRGQGTSLRELLGAPAEQASLTVRVIPPRPGLFAPRAEKDVEFEAALLPESGMMDVVAAGSIRQQIFPDPHGLGAWDPARAVEVPVYLVPAGLWRALTGQEAPATPVSAQSYTAAGLPWFDYYENDLGDVQAPAGLRDLPRTQPGDRPLGIDPAQIRDVDSEKRK
jgi:hypothetical protein